MNRIINTCILFTLVTTFCFAQEKNTIILIDGVPTNILMANDGNYKTLSEVPKHMKEFNQHPANKYVSLPSKESEHENLDVELSIITELNSIEKSINDVEAVIVVVEHLKNEDDKLLAKELMSKVEDRLMSIGLSPEKFFTTLKEVESINQRMMILEK